MLMNTWRMGFLLTLSSIVKFVLPNMERDEWEETNQQLKVSLNSLHDKMKIARNPEDIATLGNELNLKLVKFLSESDAFETTQQRNKRPFRDNESKTLSSLKNQKKKLKIKAFACNGRPDDKMNFWDACRAISDFKSKTKSKKLEKDTFHYENSFRKNRLEFSKRAMNGTLEAISLGQETLKYCNKNSAPGPDVPMKDKELLPA